MRELLSLPAAPDCAKVLTPAYFANWGPRRWWRFEYRQQIVSDA
jgi:hypothetical protein